MKKYTVTVHDDGSIFWHKEGTAILDRENGPAVEFADGRKEWWRNGKCHRTDGPAIIKANGEKVFYIEGKVLFEEEYNEIVNKNIHTSTCDGKEVIFEGNKYKLILVNKD